MKDIKTRMVNGVIVSANGNISKEEILYAIEETKKEIKEGYSLKSLKIKESGENLILDYESKPIPFERIRRITGYLVGTTDRWNDAKRAEEHDRVKHSFVS